VVERRSWEGMSTVRFMDRKTKGRLAEAKGIAFLIQEGYEVYTPFSDNSKYDVLFFDGKTINRVSVKYTSIQTPSGKWEVGLRNISRRNNGQVHTDKFTNELYDYLAVYIGPEDRVAMVPVTFSARSAIVIE
jgi:hypothetical protein